MREKQRKFDAVVEHDSAVSRSLRGWRRKDVTEHELFSRHRHREMKGSIRRGIVPLRHPSTVDQVLALADRLCQEHPEISTDPGIFGGDPHIKNIRLTVSNVLAKLYLYGSVRAVADIYAPHVSEHQIKEAIAYAQDFLEGAVHAHEARQVDG